MAYCWSGVFFDLEHKLVRADKTFLNVILRRPFAKDEPPMFLRCPACICGGGGEGHEEPYIRYSLSAVFKVVDGPRRGKVVPSYDVREDERYRDAGLKKWLKAGNKPDCFSPRRKGDQIVIDLLENFCTQRRVLVIRPRATAPDFYTCKKRTDTHMPRLRRNQSTLEFLRGFDSYDSLLSSDQNAKAMREDIVIDAGAGQVGFPFAFFYGRGVLAADASDSGKPFGTWYSTPMRTFDDSSDQMEFKR